MRQRHCMSVLVENRACSWWAAALCSEHSVGPAPLAAMDRALASTGWRPDAACTAGAEFIRRCGRTRSSAGARARRAITAIARQQRGPVQSEIPDGRTVYIAADQVTPRAAFDRHAVVLEGCSTDGGDLGSLAYRQREIVAHASAQASAITCIRSARCRERWAACFHRAANGLDAEEAAAATRRTFRCTRSSHRLCPGSASIA